MRKIVIVIDKEITQLRIYYINLRGSVRHTLHSH
jgi:hypothetical protein